MMIELDHEVKMPEGWQTAWLERTLPALQWYTTFASYVLSLTIIVFGLRGYFSIRRSTKELKSNPTDRSSIFSDMNKKVLRVTRGHFYVANVYMLHVLLLAMVDAVICAITLGKDASDDPEGWTKELVLEVALYCVYLLGIFAASFVLVPLIQMLLITWVLAGSSIKNGKNILSDYIPEARFTSTHIAQIWAMLSFFLVAWWPPAGSYTLWRYVALQACVGSAFAWLEASFAFNFRSDVLHDRELNGVANGGVREIVCMFGKTVKAIHSPAKDTLPQYEAVVADESRPLMADEKEGQ